MKIHELKILPEHFKEIKEGRKTFEIRYNDRNFQIGDLLDLKEWNGTNYTKAHICVIITHILSDFVGLKKGYVILSIKQGI